jgi:virginiamycin B lyase
MNAFTSERGSPVDISRGVADHEAVTAPKASTHRRLRLAVVIVSVAAAVAGSVLLATHDSTAKVTTRGVTATLRAPGRPGWVAAGEDALWLALTETRTTVRTRPLLRLDPASGAVKQRVRLGGRATYLLHVGKRLLASVEYNGGSGSGPSLIVALDWRTGRILARRQFPMLVGPLADSGKDLWALQVRPAALLHLDPVTLAPAAAPIPLSRGRALGLAAAGGDVWVTEPDAGEVLRIDAATGAVAPVHVGGFPVGVAVAGGIVWFADRDGGEVGRLDPRTLRPVGEPIEVGGKPGWLARAGRFLFAADPVRGTVTTIDLRSGKTAGPPIRVAPPASAASALAVAAAGSSVVWVSSFAASTLTRVSATSTADARLVASIPVPPQGGAFTVGEGAVWAMSDTTSTLLRIDPSRNAVVARIHVSPGYAAAAGEGAVWLSHPQENTVTRIDPKTNTVSATIHIRGQPAGVAVSPGAVWVADAGGPSVTRIDPATNRVVATIRVGPNRECCAEHMNLFAGTDAVWVALPAGYRIVRIDSRTNKVAASIKLGHFMPCGFVAADRSAVWAAGAVCTDAVARIDPRAKRVTAELAEPHPVGVALAFGSLWVAVFGSSDLDRIDPRTGQVVARLHVGGYPVRLGVGFGSIWVNDDKGRVLRIQPHG